MAPVEVSPPQGGVAGKRIFKFVAGVLNDAFGVDRISEYNTDIRGLLLHPPADLKFGDACDALAVCVVAGGIPPRGLAVLQELLQNSNSGSSDLRRSLGLDVPAHELFRLVTGVLNEAHPAGSAVDFTEACDSLAGAVVAGSIPSDSIDILKLLIEASTHVVVSPKLTVALDAIPHSLEDKDTTDEETAPEEAELTTPPEEAKVTALAVASVANRLFKYVVAVLNGHDVSCDIEGVVDFNDACDWLALHIERKEVPRRGIEALLDSVDYDTIAEGSALSDQLVAFLCPQCEVAKSRSSTCDMCKGSFAMKCQKCRGSGNFSKPCHGCGGSGSSYNQKQCPKCRGSGMKVLGPCNSCQKGAVQCTGCHKQPRLGQARPFCCKCVSDNHESQVRRNRPTGGPTGGAGFQKNDGPPQNGVSVTKCSAGDFTRLQDLWETRTGPGQIVGAWKVDNPLLTYNFKVRREQLKKILGREADQLEGFHGTASPNVLSIIDTGFDKGKRSGQVFGSGEYFAKNPSVSVGYCRGGAFMLVCRLTLGVQSTECGSGQAQVDGDHCWVPSNGYYVISEPDQILPQYIIKFGGGGGCGGTQTCPKLERALSDGFSTKAAEKIVPVPARSRPCVMSRKEATVLWMGFLHAHFSDDALRKDVTTFLMKHAGAYMDGVKIQVVKGHYKKAHAILQTPIPRALVHQLNSLPFIEQGLSRFICVEDAHGSPECTKCPRFIAGYCRGQNLSYTHPCFNSHPVRRTQNARFQLEDIDLAGAKGVEISDKFMSGAPFHNGQPRIIGIKAIKNNVLAECHEEYRTYLATKHMEEPAMQELYHGTNNNIVDALYQHGLQPPSDRNASDSCPVSGGKGLSTTLCDNTCRHCTEKHEWKRCHMYGLGIYLADFAQKSHRYCSQPKSSGSRQVYRMIVCSVLGKSFQVEGHLKHGTAMHDVVNVRALDEESLTEMIEPCAASKKTSGVGASIVGLDGYVCDRGTAVWGIVVADEGYCWRLHTGRIAKKDTEGVRWNWCLTEECAADSREGTAEKSDLLFVKGMGSKCRTGFSVVNSEYIAFHPHQCLPKYEIEYELTSAY